MYYLITDKSRLEKITPDTRFEVGDFLHINPEESYLVPGYEIVKASKESVVLKGFSYSPYTISWLAASGFYRYINYKFMEYDPNQQKDRDCDL